jgi:hypothetical protein
MGGVWQGLVVVNEHQNLTPIMMRSGYMLSMCIEIIISSPSLITLEANEESLLSLNSYILLSLNFD